MQQHLDGRALVGGQPERAQPEQTKSPEKRERGEGFEALQALSLKSVLLDQRRQPLVDHSPERPRKVPGVKAEYTAREAYDAADAVVEKAVDGTLESKTFQALSRVLYQEFGASLETARKESKDDPSVRVEEWEGRDQLIRETMILGSSSFLLRLHQDWEERGKKAAHEMPEEIVQTLKEYAVETARNYVEGAGRGSPAARLADSLFQNRLGDRVVPVGQVILAGVMQFEYERHQVNADQLVSQLERPNADWEEQGYFASVVDWIAPLAMKVRGYQNEPQRLTKADLASIEKFERLGIFYLEEAQPAMKASYQEGAKLSKIDQQALTEKRGERAKLEEASIENQRAVKEAKLESGLLEVKQNEGKHVIDQWESVNRHYLDRAGTLTGENYLQTIAEGDQMTEKDIDKIAKNADAKRVLRSKREAKRQREEFVAHVTRHSREDEEQQAQLNQLRRSENELDELQTRLAKAWWPPTKNRLKAQIAVLESQLDQIRTELNDIHENQKQRETGNGQSYVSAMEAADKAEMEKKIYAAKQVEVQATLKRLEAEGKKISQRARKADQWLEAHTPAWREKVAS